MRLRHLGGCMAIAAAVYGAKYFLPATEDNALPATSITPASAPFHAGTARDWLDDNQQNQVQLERTILRQSRAKFRASLR